MTGDRRIVEAATSLRESGFGGPFDLAIVLGTGLGELPQDLSESRSLDYGGVPHFPHTGVPGDRGALIAGTLEGRHVLLLSGRAHYYETGDAAAMRVPIGVLAEIGAPPLLLTNAAGSIRPEVGPGRLVAISDHINYSGLNPLIGESGHARFVDMVGAYDAEMRAALARAAAKAGIPLAEGVYMWFSGPSYETPAEVRMARTLGADLVGMSTVPEVILARRAGLRAAAVSVVTNLGAGLGSAVLSHEETTRVAAGAAAACRKLVRAFLAAPDGIWSPRP